MSGFFGKSINIDDGYIGTLSSGAIVFTASDSNPIPNNVSGIYVNSNGSFAVSNPSVGTSTIVIEHSLNLTLDSYVDDQTFQENKVAQEEINHQILTSLDGYTSMTTEAEHYLQLSQAVQDIVSIIDGYSTDIEFAGLTNTVTENNNAQQQINQSVLQALDGYASTITESEHYQQQSQINQNILQSLDGYSATGFVPEITFQENKNSQNEINHQILVALDGYTTSASSGVSETTFQENKTAQEEVNDTILSSLDGYASAQGTATQIAYFSGTNTLTSDTNLSYDTTNNRLVAYSAQITGGQQNDGYVLTSDANGVGSWQRPPIALASDKIYTVDATHSQADFTTIQAAINNASDGYLILVSPGSYNEQLNLRAGITMEIRGTGPDYVQADLNYVLSGDGYVVSGPDSGAGSIIFRNMNINLRYNGFSGSTATILARSPSFGWTFKDCYISCYTLSASGGQTHTILANASSLMKFVNCEIVADDNDGIGNVECIRCAASTIELHNTTTYGLNNYDIHIDDPAAVLYIENSTIAGALNVVRANSVLSDRVSRIGTALGVNDTDSESTFQHRLYGVGLTNGQNDFYKLNLREIGQVDVGSPNDGDIWYSRAAGRFRMKEGGAVKDMIPYSTLDGYSSGGVVEAAGFTGADGYVAFFTGDGQIAGDNDLFWDRANSRLGINTTPSYPLHIVGDSSTDALRVTNDFDGYVAHFFNDGNSPNRLGIGIQCGQDTPGGGTNTQSAFFVVCMEGDNALTGYLGANIAGTLAVVDVSDERKKKNVAPSKVEALKIINDIKLIEYNRYKGKHIYPKVDCGLGAQSLRKVLPSAVQEMPDGSLGVARSELIPVVVKAIQEQQTIIDEQRKQILHQQSQIDELSKMLKEVLSKKT